MTASKGLRGFYKKAWLLHGDGTFWTEKYRKGECTKKEYAKAYAKFYWSRPEIKERQNARMADPEIEEAHTLCVYRYNHDPEVKSRRSIAAKKRNALPEYKLISWAQHLKRKYGMSVQDYAAMLHSQNSSCAICPATHSSDNKLHVDHDHGTGKVRALLCRSCNALIGYSRENVEIMKNAISYLNSHKVAP